MNILMSHVQPPSDLRSYQGFAEKQCENLFGQWTKPIPASLGKIVDDSPFGVEEKKPLSNRLS
jgi:hypothetical protein